MLNAPNAPTFERTKALLPEVDAADAQYTEDLTRVETEEELTEITVKYNNVLEKAIDALYEDTKDRNSKSTLEQVFKAREGGFNTHFGANPPAAIRDFIGCHNGSSHSSTKETSH